MSSSAIEDRRGALHACAEVAGGGPRSKREGATLEGIEE